MDIRRTVLWMIFSFSLLLLWNNWQIHNGKPSLFGVPPAASTTESPAAANNATPSVPSCQPPARCCLTGGHGGSSRWRPSSRPRPVSGWRPPR